MHSLYKCNILCLDHNRRTKFCASKISTKPQLDYSQENTGRDKPYPESRTVKHNHDKTVFQNLLFRK